ncbi:MAG TPA: HAMP domain-containing sensor histidine kinase, partial [Vicinamibacteria bacterium]|nr:HAMP domain-containing sensor histidine kinase [Vicinamibacteria bacterium]
VTHELRTPLTTFRLYTDMLADDMVTDEARRRAYITRLRTEAERLGHLVENVLFYARVESGQGEAARETVDLQALLEEARTRLAERAARAELEVAFAPREGGPVPVRVDRGAIEQVLLNLVDNACKYAARSTPPRIDVRLETSAGRALVRVSDHGPGLSAADRRRLFQPFSKSDRDAANSAPGIGLGLALSRRLARAQGGDLTLDASGRGGAVFVLSLPLARAT